MSVPRPAGAVEAVLFDLDGVLADTERWWDEARSEFARAHGRAWTTEDRTAVMGANTPRWQATMRERLRLDLDAEAIGRAVVEAVVERWRRAPSPAIDGAPDEVRRIARARPVAIASSAHPDVIAVALERLGLEGVFRAVVSSDEVAEGKPSPDVYLLAARRVGVDPRRCVVVEDALAGVRAGLAAGAFVVLVPNASIPPPPEARELADLVIERLADLDPDALGA